jgi:hypothetical protein
MSSQFQLIHKNLLNAVHRKTVLSACKIQPANGKNVTLAFTL